METNRLAQSLLLLPKSAVMAEKRSRGGTSVDDVIDNDDLLLTILLFVPAKPLICMILVSKRWYSLISTEPFRHLHPLHRRRSDPPPSFIIRANPTCFFYFSPMSRIFRPYEFRFPYPRILQSSHGLLLLEVKMTLYGPKNYHVYNPTTAESRDISIDDNENDRNETISGICLAFDPVKSPHYSVICIRHKEYASFHRIEIYDSETRAWNQLKETFTATNDANFFNGIFWNNSIYWIRRTNERSYYLDLETRTVGTPQRVLTHRRCNSGSLKNYAIESNGHLYYVSLYSRQKGIKLKVSELLYDLVWFEKYKVNLNPVCFEFQEMLGSQLAVLCIAGGHNEEDLAVFFLVPGKIIFYRFCDGYFKDLFHLQAKDFYGNGRLYYQRGHAYQFIESLAPV